LARHTAARVGLAPGPGEDFRTTLDRLRDRGALDAITAGLFHGLRRAGNAAAHEIAGDHAEALHQLQIARQLATWFQRAFGNNRKFDPGPFVPPADPAREAEALAAELARLRDQAEAFAAQQAQLDAQIAALQAQVAAAPPAALQATLQHAATAAQAIELTEAATRRLIDDQLRLAGWEVDSELIRHARGARPAKGVNRAIAEWPTGDGRADYVLFVGLTAVAVVEAKRERKDVPGAIEQAKVYARAFAPGPDALAAGGPWGDYRVPFLFATNGRPYLKQIETRSGIWFLDARRPQNHPRALQGWYTPEGLAELLRQDIDDAHRRLDAEPTDYLGLRDYQIRAIHAAEQALAEGRRTCLLAMATGTGKTRTAIGLVYRLCKAKRFRRVLFLVDRSALGAQTAGAFKEVRLEGLQTFAEIFDLKELEDPRPDKDTRLHIATIQGMIKRVLYADDPADVPAVDQYDCIIVDECHRGYTLDREMSETELGFRDLDDYVSRYRRVLDHFDAVKIGLTATPALHTTEIFGAPTFQYRYREAVIDGHLVDHDLPIAIVTDNAEDGLCWARGEQMKLYDPATQEIDLVHLEDEVELEIDTFNRRVVTEPFNRVVCAELARQIDPNLDGKTLVFTVNDAHADLVVKLLKEAFAAQYGAVDDDAVVKITGASYQPLQRIREYRNERYPSVAVTVDLLTTGVDVPPIVNLVFLRRVKSRILYEQMLGRATRLCPEIGKDVFRIFDAVFLYDALEPYTDMKPVVASPDITFGQLVLELQSPVGEDARRLALDQLLAKLQRRHAALKGEARDRFEVAAGMDPRALLAKLRDAHPDEAAEWFAGHAAVVVVLDQRGGAGSGHLIIAEQQDALRRVERGYGGGRLRPDEYLAAFGAYLRNNLNTIPALVIVAQRPRELTRRHLKEVALALDAAGYTEAALQAAWRDRTNEDIAAGILGFIRQAALGDPLVSYETRVDRALHKILAARPWTQPQRDWLQRIAKQIKIERVVDRDALDRGAFQARGGFRHIDKAFDGNLEVVLGDLRELIWQDAG
ncbi:MAG TPA: type I restriction-modification system endonuclease, partial [Candidatus Nanopelagicales bacterium]|nr:type I restriction-modification system endonuclease [Candidatus Nanopelagicales bacterium]